MECIDCGIIGRPESMIFTKRCDNCADWTVFEAMLDAEWYEHDQSRRAAYKMDLCSWYQALDGNGVPLGYNKEPERYYAPYGGIIHKDLTEIPQSVKLSKPAENPAPVTVSPLLAEIRKIGV